MENTFKLIHIHDIIDQECLDRLVNGKITLLCETGFPLDRLYSDEFRNLFVFAKQTTDKTEYLGFCNILEEQNCIDKFEIFSEHRLQGYGRIFVNKIKDEFGIVEYQQIMDNAVGFWSKMLNNETNLFVLMLKNVIDGIETFDEFCKRLEYCDLDKAYHIFINILDFLKEHQCASNVEIVDFINKIIVQ
jgi:hypothetical protein